MSDTHMQFLWTFSTGSATLWVSKSIDAGDSQLLIEGLELTARTLRRIALGKSGAACYGCGRRYGAEYGFPDLIVPDDVWLKISPTGAEGGLLCPSCIVERATAAGIVDVDAHFTSGPFAELHWRRPPASEQPRPPTAGRAAPNQEGADG